MKILQQSFEDEKSPPNTADVGDSVASDCRLGA